MSIKHYDVVRAASPSDLAEKLTQKLKEGWQPFGSPVAITPYTLMQAIAAEGDVTTPVLVKPSDGEGTVISASRVFSSVIDMPAGRGHVTLTFNVSSAGANNWTPTTYISDLLVVVMKKSTAGISIS
ncbi:putative prophage protein [Escherichia coli]|uniref:DUF1737 domain-containing protein n=1 Tax=Escherichia coli TaxID=562 RepID=UPI0006C20FF0|nr:putative prophage protein [Escherichia coli]